MYIFSAACTYSVMYVVIFSRVELREKGAHWRQMEAELDLYAVRPSKAEVITQLVIEGLAFRRMHRPPPPRPAKRAPLPPELKARLEL